MNVIGVFLNSSRCRVEGKHLMRFQSEISAFKFLRPCVDGGPGVDGMYCEEMCTTLRE